MYLQQKLYVNAVFPDLTTAEEADADKHRQDVAHRQDVVHQVRGSQEQ